MIGDWVFVVVAIIIFSVVLVLSIIVINAAAGISAADRKDNNMNAAYNSIMTAGYMGLITSIIGLVMVFFAILVLAISTLGKLADGINGKLKIVLKSIYGLLTATVVCLAGFNMNNASNSILKSNTYKLAKFGARALLDASIKSINLAAIAYYTLGGILFAAFIGLAIYDISKGQNEHPENDISQLPDTNLPTSSTGDS